MKKFFTVFLAVVAALILWDIYVNFDYIDAFSGATPKAIAGKVPGGIEVKVKAFAGREYQFNSSTFRLLSKTRVRTREIEADGSVVGSYAYEGVPLGILLEGVDPDKSSTAPFDRPTDVVVIVKSASGKSSAFSYGELTMSTDSDPVILAYKRDGVKPEKDPEKYKGNREKPEINGVVLICPGDRDVSRYLDNVVSVELSTLNTEGLDVPEMKKGMKFVSSSVQFVDGNSRVSVDAAELIKKDVTFKWFRIGHGRGIKKKTTVEVSGSSFRKLLLNRFPELHREDFILVTGGDGYRTLFSGYEIFSEKTGNKMIVVDELEGKRPESGVLLGVISDFYIDRCVRGVAHIARIKK